MNAEANKEVFLYFRVINDELERDGSNFSYMDHCFVQYLTHHFIILHDTHPIKRVTIRCYELLALT